MKQLMENDFRLVYGLIFLLLSSCYPTEDLFVEDLDIVVTTPDESVDFTNFQTFAIPDTVVRLTSNGSDENSPGPFDQLMLDLVVENMEALGYVRELDPENNPPDLLIFVQLAVIENILISPGYPVWNNWGWWGGWWPGWGYGPGWGGYYPYVPVVSSFTTGTLFIDMIDPNRPDVADQEIPIIWSAFLNGLATGSSASIEARINTNINQAFDQSPYLGAD
ncbi:MAG: DUF4136 domain-containing protein [Cyclobacteriaceae bacterium]|nr:DUF4136 domain-containing protein [Cyclobacteriaceae bacterium]